MGLRYRIPFKDYGNNEYEVLIYREDYTGEVTELRGAPSCFVVTGTDEDFVYTPVRTSSATINVVDTELLLDLYSINNQYAPVKLLKNGELEWTGYIKPEQFTQPYVNMATSVGVECVSALATLEHIEYKGTTESGIITMSELIRTLVSNAKGGYRGVFIPNVYSAEIDGDQLRKIELLESNFVSEEMNCREVLEAACKFLNWTVYDTGGYLYFVDMDWRGEYWLYDEAMGTYSSVSGNEVTVQDIGFNGSGGNTLDVVPGYNKASVKALNVVPDEVVKDEPFDILRPYEETYLVKTYDDLSMGAMTSRKMFLKPMLWKTYSYDSDGNELSEGTLDNMTKFELNKAYGGILMKEANYQCVSTEDETPAEGVTDFDYVDTVQIRSSSTSDSVPDWVDDKVAIEMIGEQAVYADCAISIDAGVELFHDHDLLDSENWINLTERMIKVKVECGGKWWDGSKWVSYPTTFGIEYDATRIVSNRTPYTPYKDISGYVIPMDFFVGTPKISIYCPKFRIFLGYDELYCTGIKLRNLKFGYAKKDGVSDEGEGGDRVYENVVTEKFMSETEEIEFEISSYNRDGASYSKALLNGKWLESNLYSAVVDAYVRPEELMIRRIVNRYGETKIKLTEALKMTGDITPLTVLSDRTMVGKRFRMTSGEWDYEKSRLTIQMQEDTE